MGEYYLNYEDLFRITRGFHEVNFRYVLAPSKTPPASGSIAPISATLETLKEEYDMGYGDAVKAIADAKES